MHNRAMEVSQQTDPACWDERLRERGAHPLQAWAWGALKERFGWQAHRLWINDGDAAAQVLIRPYRGLSAAYVPRGPLLSGRPEVDRQLVAATVNLARSRRAAFLRFEPDVLHDAPDGAVLDAAVAGQSFRRVERTLQPRSSIRLDLDRADEELLAGFSKGHRADIRRAEREGVRVRTGDSESDVDVLHEMMRASQERKGFGIHSPGYYRALWHLFGGDGCLLLAEHAGEVVAASYTLAFAGQAIYLAAGSTRVGLDVRASHLLQWHGMRWARAAGARSYDLWGIPDARGRLALDGDGADVGKLEAEAARDPLDGVYRFKKGWGGRVVRTVPAHDRVFLAPAYWLWLRRRSES